MTGSAGTWTSGRNATVHASDSAAPPKELRLAVVMNGGVSLAVWMSGVTHELDLLRRASAAAPGEAPDGVPEYDKALWRAWRDACGDECGTRVVIDVVAGTSAGGLNGTLLATAIARGGSLDPVDAQRGAPFLRSLWENRAGLEPGQLLPPLGSDSAPESALHGEGFRKAVREELAKIKPGVKPEPVTLYVTATATGTADVEYSDSFSQTFVVADHRRLYRFRADPKRVVYGGRDDTGALFSTDALCEFDTCADELARASRASASYPVAFTPQYERRDLAGPPLRTRPRSRGANAWTIDGGVLDNAPFGPVLDSITRRPATSPLRRVLVYIVPSRGMPAFRPDGAGGDGRRPPWLKVAAAAAGLPREADLRSDIEEVQRLLGEADVSARDAQTLFENAVSDGEERNKLRSAADGLLDTYRRGRASAGFWEAQRLTGLAVLTSALRPVEEAPVDRILAAEPRWVDTAAELVDDVTVAGWGWGLGSAERCIRLMARHLRSASVAIAPGTAESAAIVSDSLTCIEALRDRAEQQLAALRLNANDVVASVGAINAVFDELALPATLGQLIETAAEAYAPASGTPGLTPATGLSCAFSVEVVLQALHARAPFQRTAPFEFLRLGPDLAVGDDEAADLISELGGRKLYGTRAWHFGAFGKVEWRRWDWLCGRLDAVAHLGHVLGRDDQWIARTQQLVLDSEGWDATAYAQRLASLRCATDRMLLRELASRPSGRRALGRLLDRVLDLGAATSDPAVVGTAGRFAAALLRSELPPASARWQRAVRRAVGGSAHSCLWRWVDRGR